jgi:hypothetical protein
MTFTLNSTPDRVAAQPNGASHVLDERAILLAPPILF